MAARAGNIPVLTQPPPVTTLAAGWTAARWSAIVPPVWFQERTGEWLGASASPGDTAVVAYGHPVVLRTADLGTPYRYL